MRYFCTYFDSNYLTRGLALYESLRRQCPEFTLWVLCFDKASHDVLVRLDRPGMRPIAHEDFVLGDEPLQAARMDRSLVEYYFTCSPSLPLYILKTFPPPERSWGSPACNGSSVPACVEYTRSRPHRAGDGGCFRFQVSGFMFFAPET